MENNHTQNKDKSAYDRLMNRVKELVTQAEKELKEGGNDVK